MTLQTLVNGIHRFLLFLIWPMFIKFVFVGGGVGVCLCPQESLPRAESKLILCET